MKTRSDPLTIPDPLEYPWFAVDVEGKDPHHFQSLDSIKSMRFGQGMAGDDGKIIVNDDPLDDAIGKWQTFGVAIGMCWRHATLEFESEFQDFDSMMEYGEAIIGELHRAGYSPTAQSKLALQVLPRMAPLKITKEEIKTSENFSEAQEAGTT